MVVVVDSHREALRAFFDMVDDPSREGPTYPCRNESEPIYLQISMVVAFLSTSGL